VQGILEGADAGLRLIGGKNGGGEDIVAGPPKNRWKDANSRSRRGYAARGVQDWTFHQQSSGKANFVSSSFHGRSLVLTSMSVILMVRRSSGSARPLNSLATSG
jgi:hypothetical protein